MREESGDPTSAPKGATGAGQEKPGAHASSSSCGPPCGSEEVASFSSSRPETGGLYRLKLREQQIATVLGVKVPLYSEAPLAIKRGGHVGSPNLGNICFVNATLQVLLRLEPFHDLLRLHTCELGMVGCAWCCAHEQSKALRGLSRLSDCPLAVMTRRGRFYQRFALQHKKFASRKGTSHHMLDLDEVLTDKKTTERQRRTSRCSRLPASLSGYA